MFSLVVHRPYALLFVGEAFSVQSVLYPASRNIVLAVRRKSCGPNFAGGLAFLLRQSPTEIPA